ncbi:MAG: hypothetical protein IJZ38_05445 [Bacteroides sp.]|nr:hypothetical protein [Bacteroides sp.]
MEIGSFIELQLPKGLEYYSQKEDIARLNTGRSAMWHAFRVTGARAIWIPYYQCDTVRDTFIKHGVEVKYYHTDRNWNPIDLCPKDDEAVVFVNYYGVMSNARMRVLASSSKHPIIDNCQAFFCEPIEGAMNIYSCRKFVGVPDGAYVIGEGAGKYVDEYPQCYSSDTAAFLLMRLEYGCEGKGYEARSINEHRIDAEDCMKMSKLTRTILDGTDYSYIQQKRRENFAYAHELMGRINQLNPLQFYDDNTIPMVYPLVVEDDALIQKLFAAKHFQGHWWSYICDELPEDSFEHWISRYVIPITIDQRYGREELEYLANVILNK